MKVKLVNVMYRQAVLEDPCDPSQPFDTMTIVYL